jgi:predicted nucleotidyltransferase
MKSKQEILSIIRSLQVELRQRFKARELGVFGSVIRGEQNQASDVDVLVDFEEGADLFDHVGIGLFIEEILGQKVDVVPRRALREEIKVAVLKEVVNL